MCACENAFVLVFIVCPALDPYSHVTKTWLAGDIWGEKETSQRMSCLSPQLTQTMASLAGRAVYMWPGIQMRLCVFVRSQPLNHPAAWLCLFEFLRME